MKLIRISIQLLIMIFPWFLRRPLLSYIFGYSIHRTAHIGFSLVLAKSVVLKKGSRIDSGNFINSIDDLVLEDYAKIGKYNWITGASATTSAYAASPDRKCILKLGSHTRITDRHYFDCNGGIIMGSYTTVAGLYSQFISHGINILENKQEAELIVIGDYCMIGSGVKVLKNSSLPDRSVLAAGSILNKVYSIPSGVFAGAPARRVKEIPPEAQYFHRMVGPVR